MKNQKSQFAVTIQRFIINFVDSTRCSHPDDSSLSWISILSFSGTKEMKISWSFYQPSKWSYQEQFQFVRNSMNLMENFGFRLAKPSCLSVDMPAHPPIRTQYHHHMICLDQSQARAAVNINSGKSFKEEDIVKKQNQKIIRVLNWTSRASSRHQNQQIRGTSHSKIGIFSKLISRFIRIIEWINIQVPILWIFFDSSHVR